MPSMDEEDSSGTARARPDSSEMSEEDMAAMQEEMESNNELLVTIEYTDSAGQRHSVEKAVQIEELTGGTMGAGMGPGDRQSSSNSNYLYGAAILAIVVVGFNYRKKKMQKAGTYEPLSVELKNLKGKILKKEKQ